MEKEVYRHFGNDKFIYPYFTPITNNEWGNKPHGGLYACPTKDVDISWESWCRSEDFRVEALNKHFDFTLKDNARVLTIKDIKDLEKLPRFREDNPGSALFSMGIDFEKLSKDYDALMVWIYRSSDISEDELSWDGIYYRLYGWDVDSLLVMNPDIIEEV